MPKLIKEAWARIGASQTILKWISEGVPLEFDQIPQECELQNRVEGVNQRKFVDTEVEKLLQKGSIKQVSRDKIHCVLPLRCVPKKLKKYRLVLDCQHVNSNIVCPTFTQEGISSVADQIEPEDELISVDLESGFHHVPVKISDQKFLGFYWNGNYYVWCVLPFGVKSAPYYFNKILRPVVRFLRENGVRNALFVDDFLFMIKKLQFTDHRDFVIQTLQELGWSINFDKSSLQPRKSCEFIGFWIHSSGDKGPWIQVTQKKLHKLRRHLSVAIKAKTVQARFLAKIGGECIAMMKAILPAKLLLRNLYRNLAKKHSWDSELEIEESCRTDLIWWFEALRNWNGAPLQKTGKQIQIETDASGTGWGAICKTLEGVIEASGTWTKDVSFQPSNYRELLAILKAIRSFRNVLKGSQVQVLSDNVTSVAYINQLGGSSLVMTKLMTTIFVYCHELGINLTSRYLARRSNQHADFLSRILTPYEWQLHPRIFKMIDNMWGPHTVDRFASELTTQLPRFNSLYWDPMTEAVDAMMQSWEGENNYVNPPFWLLSKVMKKVKREKVVATVIAPYWPAQAWFQELRRMSLGVLMKLPNNGNVMLKRAGVPEPLKNKKWRMYVWRISGEIG